MIHDLDRSIEELLRQELPRELVDQVTITFATPNHEFPPPSVSPPAVDLFLYDVRENRELRSTEPRVERQPDGTAVRHAPPVRVDCSYLVTAWASEGAGAAMDEHRLLGEVMRVLLRHRTLPEAVLQGSMRDQDLPLPTSSLQPGHLQNLGEFWQALGGRPRAALNYTVTLALGLQPAEPLGPVVTERVVRIRQETPR
jgi:hypothetical protein